MLLLSMRRVMNWCLPEGSGFLVGMFYSLPNFNLILTPCSDCSDKAFQAHKLIHWKYSLNEAVIEILESQRHLTQRKIAKRRAASSEERWVYADNIVQAWKADGTIRSLYQEFKKMMDTARTYEPRRYGR
jgi:hypothetical protein